MPNAPRHLMLAVKASLAPQTLARILHLNHESGQPTPQKTNLYCPQGKPQRFAEK